MVVWVLYTSLSIALSLDKLGQSKYLAKKQSEI